MSYDLYFKSTNASFSLKNFINYFSSRDNYTILGEGNHAWYENENTGVYFIFDFNSGNEDSDPEDIYKDYEIAFNLNYLRPHVFGLEAAEEISTFFTTHDLIIGDPQDNMGAFCKQEFIEKWNKHNKYAYEAVLTKNDIKEKYCTAPTWLLEKTWKWNYAINNLAQKISPNGDFFIPKIFFCKINNKLQTGIVWGDAVSIAIPEYIDIIVLCKDKIREKKIKFWKRNKENICYESYAGTKHLFEDYELIKGEVNYYLLDIPQTNIPAEIISFYRGKHDIFETKIVPQDLILNEEICRKCKF